MSEGNPWSTFKLGLLDKTIVPKVKPEITSNLDTLFINSTYESYILEIKKAILLMERHCPSEITTPFKGNCLEVSSCGNYFIFGSIEGRIAMVDKETKEILHDVLLEGGAIYSIALAANDSYLLAAGKDGCIRKFDFSTFEEVHSYHGHEKEINAILLSQNEEQIYSASDDGTVRVWESGSDDMPRLLYTHDGPVLCLSRDVKCTLLLSGGSDKKIKVFHIGDRQVIREIEELQSSVWTVQFSSNNRFIAAGDSNGLIKVWDYEGMQLVKALVGHSSRVTHLEFTETEEVIVSSSNDCTLRIWNLVEDKNEIILTGHSDWIKSFKVSKNQKFIYSIAENFKINMWQFPKFDTSCRKKGNSGSIMAICYARASDYVFTVDSKSVKVWDMSTKSLYKSLNTAHAITAACVNSDNKTLIVAYANKELRFWDVEEQSSEVKVRHPSEIQVVVASTDGKYLVCGDCNFRVTIYSKINFKPVHVFRRHNNVVTALAFGKPVDGENDQLFSGAEDNDVYVYAISDRKSARIQTHEAAVTAITVSRNNELLISGDKSGVFKILNISQRNCIRVINSHRDKITGIYFSENGKYFWISSCDASISLWNSTSFTQVTSLKTKYPVSGFVTTKNEIDILSAEGEEISFLQNPLRTSQFFVYGPGREYYSFMKYLVDICEGNESQHDPEMDKWIITPFEINALHFYAYFNLPQHLKAGMAANSPFYFSKSGFSPLQIAIHRNFRDCINVIMKSIRLKIENDPYSVGYLEDSVIKLNQVGFRGLDEFYESILYKATDKLLPKFCDEDVTLPIIVHSRTLEPQQKDFFSANEIANFGTPLTFMQSALKIDVVLGSSESISFLESISDCPNPYIFTTTFIRELILYKWALVKWFLLPQAMLYGLYLLFLAFYVIIDGGESIMILGWIFALNLLLTGYELFQMALTGLMYLKDIWNYVDVTRFSICYVYSVYIFWDLDEFISKQLLVALVFVSMVRGISYFRLFDNTRYMINLLSEVIKDMTSFLILLTYSTFSFALIYFIMVNNILGTLPASDTADTSVDNEAKPFSHYVAIAYLLNLGTFETNDYGAFEWIIFFFASVINPLIMLNLLISIMGDTFGRVKEEQEIADMKELTEMVIEGEYLLFCRRRHGRKTYMQICKEEEVTDPDFSPAQLLDKLKAKIKGTEEVLRQKHQEVRDELKETMGGVNRKLDEMTNLIEQISLTQD